MTSNHRNLKRSQHSMSLHSVFQASDLCQSRRQNRRQDYRKNLKAKILQAKECGSGFATLGLWLLV